MNVPIISFGNGEVTQKIDCRIDTQKYASSCRSMKNMLPLVYGCAERRTGTKYVSDSFDVNLLNYYVYIYLHYILGYDNDVVCYDNNVVTEIEQDKMPDFICYDNEMVHYDNEEVTLFATDNIPDVVFNDNSVVMLENDLTIYSWS